MYPLAKRALFRLDAERAHHLTLSGLALASRSPGTLRLMAAAWGRRDPRLACEAFGVRFPSPVGLAAGMDKDARALPAWEALGFGFAELGSVTALAQPGNPRPRLFRLPEDEALVNRMGFNNDGAESVAERLSAWRRAGAWPAAPVGINLGKSKATPLDEAAGDYARSLERLGPFADYLVVNVSSPNTPGLRELQDRARLDELLALVAERKGATPTLLKIAPDLGWDQVEEVLDLVGKHGVDGLIATNTTVSRAALSRDPGEAGGLSGRPLADASRRFLAFLRARTPLPIVSVGGILDPGDAVGRVRAGASLVQLYTGLVYRGPWLVGAVHRALVREIEREGVGSLAELVGIDAPAGGRSA